jgi:hypothetical protein
MKSKLLIAWILGILAANMVGMAQVKPVLKFPAGITPANFHRRRCIQPICNRYDHTNHTG